MFFFFFITYFCHFTIIEYFCRVLTIHHRLHTMNSISFEAALFDLDGVVFDTESQYSVFWGQVCRKYHPELPGLENKIKGQTLTQILDAYFSPDDVRSEIVSRLDEYEMNMKYPFIPGFTSFIHSLRQANVSTAVVTSSNVPKMECVYRSHPDFHELFDVVLTAEDFDESKPSPDCYLKAAQRLGAGREGCVVFEDSFNGLRSGRSAGMAVIGLSTTNPADAIAQLCDIVIPDFQTLGMEDCRRLLNNHPVS